MSAVAMSAFFRIYYGTRWHSAVSLSEIISIYQSTPTDCAEGNMYLVMNEARAQPSCDVSQLS